MRQRKKYSSDTSKFLAACRDPFSEEAEGCRVPDEYAFPTATYHVKTRMSVTSDASGNFNGAVFPSPCASVYVGNGSSTYTGTTFSGATTMGFAVSSATLAGVLSNYRVVSTGIRIRNVQPPGTAVGMLEVAQIPANDVVPSWYLLQNLAISITGITNTFLDGTAVGSILNLPDSDEFAVQELMANDLLVVLKKVSPRWMDFNSLSQSTDISASQKMVDPGGTYEINATQTVASSPGQDTRMGGNTYLYFKGSGFPNSTKALDVEIVYHIEGTPVAATGGLTSGSGSVRINNPEIVRQGVMAIARAPAARIIPPWIIHAKSNFVRGVFDGVNARLGMGAGSISVAREKYNSKGIAGKAGMLVGGAASGVVARKLKALKAAKKASKALARLT